MRQTPFDQHGIIDQRSPVNRDHPDNVGLVSWLLALDHLAVGRTWWDIMGPYHATLVGAGNGAAYWTYTGALGLGTNMTLALTSTNSSRADWGNRTPFQTTGSFSLTCWVYRTGNGPSTAPWILSKLTGTPSYNGYGIAIDESGSNQPYIIVANNGTITDGNKEASLTLDTAFHLAAVFDSVAQTITLYVNGRTSGAASATSWLADSGTSFYIGAYPYNPSGQNYQGLINDVAFWKDALSATRVRRLYRNALAGYPGRLRRLRSPMKPNFISQVPWHLFFQAALGQGAA
jgi:hypothetical protein